MRWLKSYSKYQESIVIDIKFQSIDLSESLNIDWHDALLTSISAKEITDLFNELKMDKKDYEPTGQGKLDLDFLCGDGEKNAPYIKFVDSLSSRSLEKSEVQHSDTYATFLNKPCKFMFIYKKKKDNLEDIERIISELADPIYMMFQVWHESDDTWTPVKLYEVNGKLNDFYNKLSSKTIKITDDDVDYIYSTSNGNEWELASEKETEVYKKVLRKEELEELIDDIKNDESKKSIKLTII